MIPTLLFSNYHEDSFISHILKKAMSAKERIKIVFSKSQDVHNARE